MSIPCLQFLIIEIVFEKNNVKKTESLLMKVVYELCRPWILADSEWITLTLKNQFAITETYNVYSSCYSYFKIVHRTEGGHTGKRVEKGKAQTEPSENL